MADARSRLEAWRLDYNKVRPHSGLDNSRHQSLLCVYTRLQGIRPRVGAQVTRSPGHRPRRWRRRYRSEGPIDADGRGRVVVTTPDIERVRELAPGDRLASVHPLPPARHGLLRRSPHPLVSAQWRRHWPRPGGFGPWPQGPASAGHGTSLAKSLAAGVENPPRLKRSAYRAPQWA